jgi:serine/threonine-protein kinase
VNVSNPAEALVGAVLNGRFRLVRLLGEGGMGAVYEAEGMRGEGKWAVKMLHPEFISEEQILNRFIAEAQATRSLKHPNITQVFESATAEDGTPYLVMELLQGIPVSHYLDQGSTIPPQHAVPIIYGVLQALAAAHAQRIVHRDLKPDNLFLVRDARGASHVKVLDFGIAKVMDVAGGMGSKTRTGVLLGTPGYMSPEQIKNSKGVDPRSDLWSVGVIFYEMLTGKQPFPADNEFARLTSVLTEEVKPIEQVMPQLAAWGTFFQRSLAKDPAHRFQTADEMAHALTTVAHGGSIQAATPAAQPTPTRGGQHGTLPVMPLSATTPSAGHSPSAVPSSPAMSRQPEQSSASRQYQVASWQPAQPSSQAMPMHPSAQMSGGASMPALSGAVSGPNAAVPTHVSAQKPPGTPTLSGSETTVDVVEPAPLTRGAAWWVVGVVACVSFGLGLAVGLLSAG